jgi:DNA-binding CsgD family transcriptional regulator
LSELGRTAEAADDGRRSLAISRELGYPAGEALALVNLGIAALYAGDGGGAVQLVRQAEQIRVGVPGWIARARSAIVTLVLIEAGDLAAAEPVCAAGLAGSRAAGDLNNLGSLLTYRAILDLHAGRTGDAMAHLNEALHIGLRTGGHRDLLEVLDWCGHLCAMTGRFAEAVTVWSAYTALHQHDKIMGAPVGARRRQQSLREARLTLGPSWARAAQERGAAMSMATAAEYALMLTSPSQHQPQAAPGLGQLSPRERELVTLVARGRTDAQIAAELHITVRTVRSHLDRIRDKTGCRRRADLTRLALAAGLV